MCMYTGLEVARRAGCFAMDDSAALLVLLILLRDAFTLVILHAIFAAESARERSARRFAPYKTHGRVLAGAATVGSACGTLAWVCSDAATLARATTAIGAAAWLDTVRRIVRAPLRRASAATDASAANDASEAAASAPTGPLVWSGLTASGMASGLCAGWTGLAGPPLVPALEALRPQSPEVAVALVTTAVTPAYCLGVALALASPRGRALVAASPVLVLAVAVGVVTGVSLVTCARRLSAQRATDELAGRVQRAALRVMTGLVGPVGAGLLSLSPVALAMAGALVVLAAGRGVASLCGKGERDGKVLPEQEPTLKRAAGDEPPPGETSRAEAKPPTMSEDAFRRAEETFSAMSAEGDTAEVIRVEFDRRSPPRSNSSTGLMAMFAPPADATGDDGRV